MKSWSFRRDDERARRLRADGAWGDETIADYARALANRSPNRIIVVDGGRRLSATALLAESESLARSFVQHGLAPGAVVSYMLPNWYETCVISLAAALAGLVLHPLLPIYREREVTFMLADSESQLLFIPARFRNFDYRDFVASVRSEIPRLHEIVVVRGSSREFTDYEQYADAPSSIPLPEVCADAIKMVIYTSGTTGSPKGVLHSHNTILADVRSLAKCWSVTEGDCFFVPSPVTHIGGSLYAHEFIWYSGAPAVLLDRWDPSGAAQLIGDCSCTISAGATPFLRDLVQIAQSNGMTFASLRLYICGGAEVPPALVRLARRTFAGCVVCRVYGSTEVPTVTAGALPTDDEDACAETDGALCGTEALVVDPEGGTAVAFGSEGELIVRGPEMFLGYSDPRDNAEAFTPDGYFRTGDLGRLIDDRHVLITGRKKDLIIRAGENISAKELEDVLGEHPAIAEVSVVAVPSDRTGEAVCACLVRANDATIALPEIARFMIARGCARQKIPEALLALDSLPRTATGKVRKEELRQLARIGAVWADRAG